MKAKKSLGQNFLNNKTICDSIVFLLSPTKKDLIIEIGPGKGILTKKLKKHNTRIIGIEIDKNLKEHLSLLEDDNCKIIYNDILKTDIQSLLKDYKYNDLYIVGNLPYYITTPIIEHIIKSKVNPIKMVFMVQKEVAERFSATPNTKKYGYITVYLNHYFDIKKELFVSKKNFSPKPKVDSQVISFIRKEVKAIDNEQEFFEFVKECFIHKRKTLKNNIGNRKFSIIKGVLNENGFNDMVRAESLNEEMFIKIYLLLKKKADIS